MFLLSYKSVSIEENYHLLPKASKRLAANDGKPAIPIEDVMKHFEITEEDIADTEELEIERFGSQKKSMNCVV